MMRPALTLALLLHCAAGLCQVAVPVPPGTDTFAEESLDWNVEPSASPHGPPYGRPTPTSIRGGRVITTLELGALLEQDDRVVVIDVLDSSKWDTLPSARWMPGAGESRLRIAERNRFAATLENLTGKDKRRPLVFMCLSSRCWESYNASLHAMEAGYEDVLWFRGGRKAWVESGLPRARPGPRAW